MRSNPCGLHSQDAHEPVALQSVHAKGRLQGLVLRMTLRQVYRNDSDKNLECVYTFALSWGSVLLSMAVELNGKRLSGSVVEKHTAEVTYENAIQTGDLPVMLERSSKDLYSASLGNLQPGDEVVIEIEYAQLLKWEGGVLRMSLPTTMAPRYGHEHARGGLPAHHTTSSSTKAQYRLNLALDVQHPLDKGTITCPSHGVQLVKHPGGVTVKLQSNAWLDRDFVVTIYGLKAMSFAVASADATQPGQYTMLVSTMVPSNASAKQSAALRLKVLVDGSDSMQGDSNAQARDALDWLFHQLQPSDEVSMSRFGSHTVHVLPHLQRCTDAYQRRLRAEARILEADLGGTEMDLALRAVIGIQAEDERPVAAASILLITDGAVWDIENIVATVRRCGHRVFALGVGSSPAESLLRELVEVSGGACVMVSPNQSMQQGIAHLLDRMRRSHAIECSLLSDAEPLHPSSGAREMTQGDTLHRWAQLTSRPQTVPSLQWTVDGKTHTQVAEKLQWDEQGVLARLGAAQRLLDITDEGHQRALALQYQLVTAHTRFILVHERVKGDKAQGLPALQQVAQMQAAGASGFGTVARDIASAQGGAVLKVRGSAANDTAPSVNRPALWRTNRAQSTTLLNSMGPDHDFEIPAFLRRQTSAADTDAAVQKTDLDKKASKSPLVGHESVVMPSKPAREHLRLQRDRGYTGSRSPLTAVLQSLTDPGNPLADILTKFNSQSYGNQSFRAALSRALSATNTTFIAAFVMQHAKIAGSPAMVWAVLMLWLADAKGLELDKHARRLLEAELVQLGTSSKAALLQSLETAAAQNKPADGVPMGAGLRLQSATPLSATGA
jgi:Ca-activated chloride channel family protein